jgi:hypothetical protein
MLLYRTSSACLNDLLAEKSSSLLRMLVFYGSAFYSEIFNALGTDIVTACLTPVKGYFSASLLESGIGFSRICLLGETCALLFAQRGVIILPASLLSRVNQYQYSLFLHTFLPFPASPGTYRPLPPSL